MNSDNNRCWLYSACPCRTGGCYGLPDDGCPVYRWFKKLIEEREKKHGQLNDGIISLKRSTKGWEHMYKVILTWAGTETEETIFETKEEAEQYIKDVVGPGSNSHATIIKL